MEQAIQSSVISSFFCSRNRSSADVAKPLRQLVDDGAWHAVVVCLAVGEAACNF